MTSSLAGVESSYINTSGTTLSTPMGKTKRLKKNRTEQNRTRNFKSKTKAKHVAQTKLKKKISFKISIERKNN